MGIKQHTGAALIALAALGCGAQADTSSNDVAYEVRSDSSALSPYYGNLDTFYGNLDTFYGNLDTFYGNLDTFYGNLDTFYGNLDTFYGNLDTFYGNLDTFYGNLDTFWGNLDTFYGNLDTFYGNLDTFYGPLSESYGNLDTFWGNLDTFNGNLDTSWGNLDTFWGNLDTFYGNLDTFYGNLDTFWGNLDTFWGNLDTFWGNLDTFGPDTAADYEKLLADFGTFYNMSQDQFGVPVALVTKTDFYNGFAKGIFAKYGIDPSDPSTLAGLSDVDRAKFFVDWYDGLMQFSGIDRVDSWMGPINWSPAITQDHDYNTEAVIGLLDFGVTDQTALEHNVIYSGGYDTIVGEDTHGSAVVSLMIAPHDGQGVMGIAPDAAVAVYNPFDATKTAGWEDVETGINTLVGQGARVINMSLGVPETVLSEEWGDILGSVVADPASEGTIFVKAAGNEGATQSGLVNWSSEAARDRLIIVGATGYDGEIAGWSNRAGDTCLTFDGTCSNENRLMNRFIVAPGEFLIVSDGQGGVMRQSGTSFAAPLVSGTAALIHGAWPWWKQHGEETVDVILSSATDLGAPGIDEVYGVGMLNVEGALSPLDFDNLTFYSGSTKRGLKTRARSSEWARRSFLRANVLRLERRGAYLVGLETVGDTFRDFRIPLSTTLYGGVSDLDGRARERKFQRHLHQRFVDWATTGQGFSDIERQSVRLGAQGEWSMSMVASPYSPGHTVREGDLPFQSSVQLMRESDGAKLALGVGDSAALMGGSQVFGFYSDFDVETGGVNPFLGLASGGSFASVDMPLSDRLSIQASVTETEDRHEYVDPLTGTLVRGDADLADYRASASQISAKLKLAERMDVSVGYTRLDEANSLFGDQGTGLFALDGGATTDALTVGVESRLPRGINLALSATHGETAATRFADGALAISDDGLTSTAFAVALSKRGVFGDSDFLRVSLAQPLSITEGALTYSGLEVVDRETGALGLVSQSWAIDQQDPRYVTEISYAQTAFGGQSQFSAFIRADSAALTATGERQEDVVLGSRLAIRF